MDNFEDKYGIEEDQSVKNYHKSRRMFVIKDGTALIADEGVDYSHAEWFKKIGLGSDEITDPILAYVRGSIEKDGLYFYKGYDFQIDEELEAHLIDYLKEVVGKLKVSPNLHVYGGKIIEVPGEKAAARKDYGTVSELLKLR